jgi:hypothetical protein
MLDRLIGNLEITSLRRFPKFSISIRTRRHHAVQHDERFLKLFDRLQKGKLLIQTFNDAYNVYHFCGRTARVPGDVAEFGVFKGGTARLLCEVKGSRPLHLFDTFDLFGGMPAVQKGIDIHRQGDFKEAKLNDVKTLLADFPDVNFYPGFFPDSAKSLGERNTRFSFVHLDVDIYQSTLDGLKFFYPRLSPGGMLVSHDYRFLQCKGVRKAFDEFFSDKPESVLELWDTQALVIKQ